MHNDTWELTDLPPGCKALRCKWIIKRKMKVDGSIDKYKARLVIQGFRQNEGIDFFDTYAPVARISTIRLLLALAAIHDLVIHQMDVKTAFLNGDLDEEIYMKQPEGFVMHGHESKCVYSKFDASGKGVIICLYVDDMLIFGTDQDQVNKTKEFLSSKFDMKDLGEAEVILGNRIKRGNNDPTVKFQHNKRTPVSQLEYSRAIECLMYAMISTIPDIAFAVGKLSRYTSNPSALHWQALESEFVALAAAGNEAKWLRNLVYEIPLWPKPISTISIRCDSAATLAKAYSQVYNGKKAIGSHWIFKTKFKADGTVDRKKARLIVQGNRQWYGVDYQDTFAPIAKMVTIRSLLAVVDVKGWFTCQMDVSNAFLHGDLLEEVYLKPPLGYTGKGKIVSTDSTLDSHLVLKTDYSLFVKKEGASFTVVLVYVDQHTKLLSKLGVLDSANSQLDGGIKKEKEMAGGDFNEEEEHETSLLQSSPHKYTGRGFESRLVSLRLVLRKAMRVVGAILCGVENG
uniref:Zinc finger, CCHC-type n=1 Tax=Tanacetum cinerariifolium TaxID=118510 RepID=A0A6L2LJ48_TANCI|nr:zinc finger, CCHC-type [Tanacetum cinerariifolium]